MSEANNAWRVADGDDEHVVESEYTMMLGRIDVRVDGSTVLRERILISRTALEFPVGARHARLMVDYSYGGLYARTSLFVDDQLVEPQPR